MLRIAPAALLLLTTCIAGTGCRTQDGGRIPIRITLAGSPANMSYLPHSLAQQLGYYTANGVNVSVEAVAGGTKAMQALLGGSADVVLGFYDHTVRVSAQGQSVRAFVVLTRFPGNVLMVSPATRKSIRQITDLKGCLAGVTDLGSQNHLFLNYLLVTNGLTPADITPVAVGAQPAAVAALERGAVDVISSFDPGVSLVLKRHPSGGILADARTQEGVRRIFGIDNYPGAVLYTKSEWLERNPDYARRLVRAVQQSLAWIAAHSPDEVVQRLPREYVGEDRAVYLEALRKAMPMFSKDGRMPPDAPQVAKRVVSASIDSVGRASFDVSKTYTNEFISGQ